MTDIANKIAKIAALQETTAQRLKELLTRDPRKEMIYGPQYDPHNPKRFESNIWQTLLLPGAATPQVLVSPNSNEEITLATVLTASALPGALLKVEMDDNIQFKNAPANVATRVRFIPALYSVVNGANWNYGFNDRFPCVYEWLRITLVTHLNVASAWTAGTPLNIGFHGK